MIHYKTKKVKTKRYDGFTCSRCGDSFDKNDSAAEDKMLIISDGLFVDFKGPFYSPGKSWEITLCGDCTFDIFHEYVEYIDED